MWDYMMNMKVILYMYRLKVKQSQHTHTSSILHKHACGNSAASSLEPGMAFQWLVVSSILYKDDPAGLL